MQQLLRYTNNMMTMQPNYSVTLYLKVMRPVTFNLPPWFTPVQNNGDMQLLGFGRAEQTPLQQLSEQFRNRLTRRCDAGVGNDVLLCALCWATLKVNTHHAPQTWRELASLGFSIYQVGKRWLALWSHNKKVPGLNPPFCVEFACTFWILTQAKGLQLVG